jgi:cell division GTPase FtsZ
MSELKKLMSSLDISYKNQMDILSLTEGLSFLSEEDFIETLNLRGEIIFLKFTDQNLEKENSINQVIGNKVKYANSILIIIEATDEVLSAKAKKFIEHIYSSADDDATVKFGFKIILKLSSVFITLFLSLPR